MCPRAEWPVQWLVCLLCAASLAPAALAQDEPPEPAPQTPADPVEAYLDHLGLRELRATHLRSQLSRARLEERLEIANRLGTIYARMLDEATTRESRERIATLARELLESVPESRSFDLRINLAKSRYLIAEEIAERWRVRVADQEQVTEAREILREVGQMFDSVGDQAHRLVEELERRERRARDEDEQTIDAMLDEARRHRSLARYYAGWSRYYTSFLSGTPASATEALRDFAWILQSGGERVPKIDLVPGSHLRFEHVARAALGVAFCYALRDNQGEALQWIDLLRDSDELPQSLRDELFAHRLTIYAGAKRWADIEWMIHQRGRVGSDAALTVGEARLLAVLSLEGLAGLSRPEGREIVTVLAQVALGELVKTGEVGHVLDLVERYDTTPIGQDGFIVRYVRGLQLYTDAREEHASVESQTQRPAQSPVLRTRYRQAADLLGLARRADDADRFETEAARCGVLHGLAHYYADEPETATEILTELAQTAPDPQVREDAMWYAIVAMERGIEIGRSDLSEQRDQLSAIFLETYPASERSVRLVLQRAGTDLIDPRASAEILLAIEPGSPLRPVAVRHAASQLYRVYRASRTSDRDFAALRFIEVAEESIEGDLATIRELPDEELIARAQELLIRLRQILDASMGLSSPDISRARWSLTKIEELRLLASVDIADIEAELAFRRFQIALSRGNEQAAAVELSTLRRLGGRFSDAADRTMYRRAYEVWDRRPNDSGLAREVVAHGSRVLGAMRSGGMTMSDPAMQSLADKVSQAAQIVWDADQDEAVRDAAIALDRELLDAGLRPASVLDRFAQLSEAAGNTEDALDAWRTLLAALATGSPSWYQARYHSIRLLLATDPARAREVMDQHKLLHPDFSTQPAPWGDRLQELDRQISPAPQPPSEDG